MQLVIDGISKIFENKGRQTVALEGIDLSSKKRRVCSDRWAKWMWKIYVIKYYCRANISYSR